MQSALLPSTFYRNTWWNWDLLPTESGHHTHLENKNNSAVYFAAESLTAFSCITVLSISNYALSSPKTDGWWLQLSLMQASFSLSFPFRFLYNWLPILLPRVATLPAVRLLCQSRVTSLSGGPLHVLLTYSKRCSSGGLQWLIVLILCVVPGANTGGWVNREQTDKNSRCKERKCRERKGHIWQRKILVPTGEESMDWIRMDSVGEWQREREKLYMHTVTYSVLLYCSRAVMYTLMWLTFLPLLLIENCASITFLNNCQRFLHQLFLAMCRYRKLAEL